MMNHASPDVTALKDGLIEVPHGFFTRHGGVSEGIYTSLNCGIGSDDEPAAVLENRARVAAHFALPPERLVTLYQIHSAEAVTVTAPWGPAADGQVRTPRADAMATSIPGLALGILSADCAPVLLADVAAGVVGAAHAGWRGARAGVVEACVAAMTDLGAERERLRAVIGPCIGPASYEVGADFRAAFELEDEALFRPAARDDHFFFDLPAYVRRRLTNAGVGQSRWIGEDTVTAGHSFFSYRRSRLTGEPDYGRLLSVIALPDR